MKERDVILGALAQANGRLKTRPAIFLREMPPPHRDLLVGGISTQLNEQIIGFDEVISSDDDDFTLTGLRTPSLIRIGFLFRLPRSRAQGRIGSISMERHRRLLRKLSHYLVNAR